MGKDRQKSRTNISLVRENERLKIENGALRSSRRGSNLGLIGKDLVKWGGIVLTTWLGLGQIAGKTTKFNLDAAVDVCGSLSDALKELAPGWIVQLVSLAMVLTMFAVLVRYKRLLKTQSNRLGELTQATELAHDPRRSSSGLGADGQTHVRDER